jgi:hypothetical protein
MALIQKIAIFLQIINERTFQKPKDRENHWFLKRKKSTRIKKGLNSYF